MIVVALVLAGAMIHRWLFADLGAERRGRRAACASLAEISAMCPESAAFALAALEVASLPGDPTVGELLNGPG